jgi:hypothetical protein
MTTKINARQNVLLEVGANARDIEELLAYNSNLFFFKGDYLALPLEDEPFVEAWLSYVLSARTKGIWPILQEQMVQLNFPIQAGISQSENYDAATKLGVDTKNIQEATGLDLARSELLELQIYQSQAGKIPLLITKHRPDFVKLVQALTARNEPRPVPDSMGAQMVAGYNNWGRIRAYRKNWEQNRNGATENEWKMEFSQFISQKELYQDRFIILSDGPYSGVPAYELGLEHEQWREFSLLIRREHECTHYFTRRIFGSMRNNMLDELIADYMGIRAAAGCYRADWFLRFVGLDVFPECRADGRINNYRGNPLLSEGAFSVLKHLVRMSAINLEDFDQAHRTEIDLPDGTTLMLIALTSLTMEELASKEAPNLLGKAFEQAKQLLIVKGNYS